MFHYTTAQGLLGIVESNRMWASDVLYMNDSSEVDYGRSLIIACAADAARGTLSETARDLFLGMEHVLYPVGMMNGDGFFATCLCEDDDLLSQWRGYSGRVGGYCLGLHTRELGRRWGARAPEQQFVLRRVIYTIDEQQDLVRGFLVAVDQALGELTDASAPVPDARVHGLAYASIQRCMLECMLVMKNAAFREEKEWRLIHHRSDFPRRATANVQYRPTPSFIIPYVSLDVTPMAGVHHDRIPLSRVVVGPTPHPEAAVRSAAALLRARIPFVEVVNSKVPLRS